MKKPLVIIGIILSCTGSLIVVAGTVYTLLLPNIYAAQVRISVLEDNLQINPFKAGQDYHSTYNPYFLRTQFEIIQSTPILDAVINRLNLREEWGMDGSRLPREVALQILANSITVIQERDTTLIRIMVKRNDPDEAARIANEMAATYCDARLETVNKKMRSALDSLDKALKDQAQRVLEAEKRIQALPMSAGGPAREETEPFRMARADLKNERFIYDQLNTRIRQEMLSMEVPRNPVEIIDMAEPNRRPVSPNLFMNVLLSALIGCPVFVAGIVLLGVGISKKRA